MTVENMRSRKQKAQGEDTGKIKQIELFGNSEQLKGRLLDGNNRRS